MRGLFVQFEENEALPKYMTNLAKIQYVIVG